MLLGGLILSLLGVSLTSLVEQFWPDAAQLFDSAGGLLGGVFIGSLVGSAVLVLLGFLVSGWILKGGRVRKPWGTTWSAILIAGLLGLPLLFAYAAISSDELPFPLVALLGTVIVGVLVWLWMTWGHRGPAIESVTEPAPAVAPPSENPGVES